MKATFAIILLTLFALVLVRACWTFTLRTRTNLRLLRESRERIYRDGMICIRCGYNMRASPHRCSECGYEPGSGSASSL